jgi:hypothetical protein
MKKLESLKNSKFDIFKGNEIQEKLKLRGGEMLNTIEKLIIFTEPIQDRYDTVLKCEEFFIGGVWIN